MINPTTYRVIVALLSISILLGVTFPRDLHAGTEEFCDSMMSMHDNHNFPMSSMMAHENCPKDEMSQSSHSNHASQAYSVKQHSEIDCACCFENPTVKTEARVLQKSKSLVFTVIDVLNTNHTIVDESTKNAIQRLDSYSPPPIYLINESFLI